jgi:NADH dehydrogenase (ubiquinone) 1 alpha subcomplex subunit 9
MSLHRLVISHNNQFYLKTISNTNSFGFCRILSNRLLSDVPSERKADFVPRVISKEVFPDVETLKLKRGTGGRSSFNGQIVTVFGGGGFLGKYVINKLAKVGAQVIIPYRGDHLEVIRLKLCGDLGQILFFHFNLKDVDSIYKSMKYSNVVINLIGKDNETNNFDFDSVHVEGARTIARIAREVGIKRLVHVSALNVTPNPTPHVLKKGSQWLRSKYYGELAVREEFPDAIIIRPADIHGHDDHFSTYFCKWQRRQWRKIPLHRGGYDVFKQPVFVSDVAQAIVNSISDDEAPGTTFEALGPRRYELRSLVEYINRCIQKTPEFDFKVTNLLWAPTFKMRINLFSRPNWLFKYPMICWEKLERESITDIPTGLPTIQDLGVKLTYLEDKWPHELKRFRKLGYYGEEVGEFPPIENPPIVPNI